MRRILISTLACLTCLIVYAQNWQKLVMNGEKDFNKIQEAFYAEWDGKKIDRGSGYKLFKRWEYRMLPRLTEGKFLPNIGNGYFIKQNEKARVNTKRVSESSWESLGPNSWTNGPNGYNPGNGRVNCIDVHPEDPNTLFLGTPAGGLWRSNDSGSNWVPVFDDLSVLGVTDFYIDPQNTNRYYLLTGDAYGRHTNSIGVLISEDAGETWAVSGFNPVVSSGYRNYRMIVNPSNSDMILVAGNGGLLKSTDAGATWTNVLDFTVTDVEFKPGNPTIVYASTSSGAFYQSSNSGSNWTQILSSNSGLGRTAIGVSEANPDYVYMLASTSDSRFGGVYKSVNSGASMTLQSDSPNIFGYSQTAEDDRGQGNYDLAIAVNPNDAEDIYVSGIHIWNSKNGGQTWFDELNAPRRLNYWVYNDFNTTNYVHADNHTLDFLNGELYAGCDGGIFKSSDFGDSWTDLSQTLNIGQFYRLGQDPNDPVRITAGAQDNGSNLRTANGWVHLYGADGMEALIDPQDGNRVYTSFQFGGVIRFYNNNYQRNISSILTDDEGEIRESGGWISPFVLDPSDSETIFLGLNNIWKSEDRGDNWSRISDFNSTSTMRHMSISAINPNYIYVTTGWNAYRTTDGGLSWSRIMNGLPSEYMTYISVSEDNPEIVYATFSGYRSGEKVYMSLNAGQTWSNISDGLPNLPANCIVHLRNSHQLFVGTDVGIYQRNGDGTWFPWFEGLPNVEVTELEVHYGASKIRAATFGRGIWERDINVKLELLQVTANKQEVLVGEEVVYNAGYTGTTQGFEWEFPGGTPSTSSLANPVITYDQPGNYDASLTLIGEDNPSLTLTNAVTVFEPVSILSIASDNETIPLGSTVNYSVEHTGEVESYRWVFEGGNPAISEDPSPSVKYRTPGSYKVNLTINGFNSDNKLFENFINVIIPLSNKDAILDAVYPTISSRFVTFEFLERSILEILTTEGKVIHSAEYPSGKFDLNIGHYQAGLYFIKVNGNSAGKFIKR